MNFALFSVDPGVAALAMIGGLLLAIVAFGGIVVGMGIAGVDSLRWSIGCIAVGLLAGAGAFYLFAAPFSLIGGNQLAIERNVPALVRAADSTYGLHLTAQQAKELLGNLVGGSRRDRGFVASGPQGDSYILQADHHVAHVQLMYVNGGWSGEWLLVKAGSQAELPRA